MTKVNILTNSIFLNIFFVIFITLERDSGTRNMSIWDRSGCSNTSISSMLQNSIYQVASSRELLK